MKKIKIKNYFLKNYTLGYNHEEPLESVGEKMKMPSTFEIYGIIAYVAEAINQYFEEYSDAELLMTPGRNFCFDIHTVSSLNKEEKYEIKYANMTNKETLFENMRFIITEGEDEVEVEGLYRLSAISLTKNDEIILDFEAYDLIQSHQDIIPNEFTVYLDY